MESKTIRLSEDTKNDLDILGHKGESYEDIIKRTITFTKKFSNEIEFTEWFKENYMLFGFTKIIKQSFNTFPDFVLLKDGIKVRVELETISSNFIFHGHKPQDVDLVICLLKDTELPVPLLEIDMFRFEKKRKICFEISKEQKNKVNRLLPCFNLSEKLREELNKILDELEKNKQNQDTKIS
jgi:hypothetical protein